jgi:hypothetical protein
MAPLPRFINSPTGRLLHLVVGLIFALVGILLSTTTAGAGLLGLGIFGLIGGIFSARYAKCLQRLLGSPVEQMRAPQDDAGRSLYELNFVRESLRRERKK